MSMFIVNENCLNDVANLVVKLNPNMDLKEVFNKLLNLNIEVWNNKYNENVTPNDLNYKVIDYNNYTYVENGMTKFKDEYFNTQITQLVQSLSCYEYQIEESYIENLENRFTYSFIKEVYDNPLIKEIIDFINYNDLNSLFSKDNELKKVNGVKWDR